MNSFYTVLSENNNIANNFHFGFNEYGKCFSQNILHLPFIPVPNTHKLSYYM